jgi:HAD superfamily hydrolase (TIGR01509 family)
MIYKCIIFDCDGVLVDSEAISATVYQQMMSELGFEISFERILKQITGTSMHEDLRFFTQIIGKDLPEKFENEFRERTYEKFRTELKPVIGVRDLLKSIKVPVCVASGGPPEKIRLNLTNTDLIGFFGDNIFSSYEIGSWKPDPGIYLYAAQKMGFNPRECAVIEDSESGIQSAIAGGFDVFGFSNVGNRKQFKKMGAKVFTSMNKLKSLIIN